MPKRRLQVGAAVLAAVAAALLGLGSAQTFAAQVSCGETITQDTKLSNDLIDCPGYGLVIGADDVTLDLNGHTIDGVGTGIGIAVGGETFSVGEGGVVTGDYFGYQHVTIENGTVRDFPDGIRLESSNESHLKQLTVSNILSVRSENVWIERNDVDRGIGLGFSGGLIEGNRVSDGGIGFSYRSAVVRHNFVSGSQGDGILAGEIGGSTIEDNVVVNNKGRGINLLNHVENNWIARNKVLRNGGDGIFIDSFLSETGRNQIVDNTSSDNGRNGILLAWDSADNVVKRNTTDRNAEDGIHIGTIGDVFSETNTLTENKARRNGDLGIEATPYTIDGGGNRAFGNGNPLQCLNVACGR